MTAGERLAFLAKTTGTAGALLLLIGSGATAGAALVDYSQLPSGTAAAHLLTDMASAQVVSGGWSYSYPIKSNKRKKKRGDEEGFYFATLN